MPYSLLYRTLLLVCLWSAPLYAQPDYAIHQETDLYIEAEEEDTTTVYELTSEHRVLSTYISKQSLKNRTFRIGESYFAPIEDLRAYLNNDHHTGTTIRHNYVQQRDVLTSDYRLHTVTFPASLRTGDVAEYTYECRYKGIEHLPLLTLHNVDSIVSYTVTVHHPENIRIDFDIRFTRHSLPFDIDRTVPTRTVLTFAQIGEAESLYNFSFNDVHAWIQIIPYDGDRAITPVTPKAFTDWYLSLFDQNPVVDAVPEYLQRTLAALPDNRSRLAALNDFVRTTIRYIAEEHSMGAIVPRSPSAVLARGFGDCKDRAFLIYSLAKRLGIDNVYMALIHTDMRPVLSGCHMWQYNHMICAYEEKGEVLLFDPTAKYTVFGDLPELLVDHPAFVLNPDNPRHVVARPVIEAPFVDVAVTASLQAPGRARARIRLRGRILAEAQSILEHARGDLMSTALAELVAEHFHSIAFGNMQLVSRGDTVSEFSADADLSRFLIPSQNRVHIPSTPFPRVSNDLVDRTGDTFDLDLYLRDNIALSVVLQAPGYHVEPAKVSIGKGTTGRFTADIAPTTDGIELRYHFIERNRTLRGEEKRSHLQFCAEYLNQKKALFTLTGGTP